MRVVSKFFLYVCAVSLSLLDLTKMVTIKKLHSRLHTPVSGFAVIMSIFYIQSMGFLEEKTSLCLLHFLPLQLMSDSSCTDSFRMKPFKAEGTCVSSVPASPLLPYHKNSHCLPALNLE